MPLSQDARYFLFNGSKQEPEKLVNLYLVTTPRTIRVTGKQFLVTVREVLCVPIATGCLKKLNFALWTSEKIQVYCRN